MKRIIYTLLLLFLAHVVYSQIILPQDLIGNWFNKETGEWEICFLNKKNAIYKCQLWRYDTVNISNGKGFIKLKNETLKIEIFLELEDSLTCMFGELPNDLKKYCKEVSKQSLKIANTEKSYELPIFKIDSAIYKGYFKNYTPSRTMTVYVDDILTGIQKTYLMEISREGYFSMKIPIYYPHKVWIMSSSYNGFVFLEPGKELFQLIERNGFIYNSLFMGESAKINTDLVKADRINSPDLLDSIDICAKAKQVQKYEIVYKKVDNYSSFSALKGVKLSMTPASRSYFNNQKTNDPLAVISNSYDTYINRLEFSEIIPRRTKYYFETSEKRNILQEQGYTFSIWENELLEKCIEIEKLENSSKQKKFKDKYEQRMHLFKKTYRNSIPELFKSYPLCDYALIEKSLLEKGVSFSEDERKLLKAYIANDNNKITKKIKQFHFANLDSIRKFNLSYLPLLYAKEDADIRNQTLFQELEIQKDIAADIMLARSYCQFIINDMNPVDDNVLTIIKTQIKNPFIAEYIDMINQQTKEKIIANKQKSGVLINEVPKTKTDLLFDSIMKKYKGKVVYVDFWATWCGPCRIGIEQIKPLKDEMSGENVVFLYITNQTSAEKTWMNLIPNIKGEHYRVSEDEWNYLCNKFNIAGIPHYVLVGKKGQVLNPNLLHMNNQALKTVLEKHLKE